MQKLTFWGVEKGSSNFDFVRKDINMMSAPELILQGFGRKGANTDFLECGKHKFKSQFGRKDHWPGQKSEGLANRSARLTKRSEGLAGL